MSASSAPIGVFDSGIGGLTVVRRIMELLPHESILYVGDTARIPYGPKSPETVRDFAREIGGYLVAAGVKAVVIACNTASAYGLSTLSATLPVPVLGVIAPGARAAAAASVSGRIGVIGTRGTVSSEAYQSAILALRQEAHVHAAAAPLLVPLVEEGHLDDDFTRLALGLYLDPLLAKGIDTLVLGCTHYPLLEPAITRHLGPSIRVVDSAHATAFALKELLAENGLAATDGAGRTRYFATDHPEGFRVQGERFLGRPLRAVQLLAIDELEEYR
jgi:glutamate racemase